MKTVVLEEKMNTLWDRFWLWLFRDLMPPENPLLPYKVVMQELTRQFSDVMRPTMIEAVEAAKNFSVTLESLKLFEEEK